MRPYPALRLLVPFAALVAAAPLARAEPPRCLAAGAVAAEPDPKSAPEVTTDELKEILRTGAAVVFDARPQKEYATSHIPGAVNVAPKPGQPMSLYVSDVREIERVVKGDKAAAIVLYCNGPLCGKSKRLAAELAQARFTHVRRYQLGIPTWRALGNPTAIEPDGVRYVRSDGTAVFLDARPPERFAAGTFAGARNVTAADVAKAKDDGRLPMEDHATRVIVFGADPEQARVVATAVAQNAFHNVSFFTGPFEELPRDGERRPAR